MASKRKLQESETQSGVHESRQSQVYGSNSNSSSKPRPAKKPRNVEPARKQLHASSVNAIKKKIRDVSRRLERSENIPADIRVQDERALATFEQELAEAEAEKTRQKMISKYHMVRFFERQKATRLLKKLRKQLIEAESTEEVETLKNKMHVAEVDLNYTQYCPLSEPYVSLYPPKGTASKDEDDKFEDAKPKPKMWVEVENCMKVGGLDKLRNRPAYTPATANTSKRIERRGPKPKQAEPVDTTGMNRRERRSLRGLSKEGKPKNKSTGFEKNKQFGATLATTVDEADDDSEGGFFED